MGKEVRWQQACSSNVIREVTLWTRYTERERETAVNSADTC